MLVIPTIVFVALAINFFVLPVYYENKIDNCYVYLELRFGKAIRKFVTIIYIVDQLLYLPVVMFIPSLTFVEVTKQNIHVVNTVIACVCIVYTMLGGIQAVVWTDVLQGFIMLSSVVIVNWFGVSDVGGLGEVWNRAVDGDRIFPPNFTLDLVTRTTFWNTVSSLFILWLGNVAFSQSCVQRLTSLPSVRAAQKSMLILIFGVAFLMMSTCGTGIIMYAYYYNCDPVKAHIVSKYDKLTPRFVQDTTGHITGMLGVFISCVFSASLSTVSAALHSLSGIFYNDYIRPRKWFVHTDARANFTMRLIVILIGVFCILSGVIVDKFQSVFQMAVTLASMGIGAIFGAFSLGMLYPSSNKYGVFSGMIISMVTVVSLVINTQYNIAQGKLRYDILPTRTDGCNGTIELASQTPIQKPSDGFALYKIAFQWYPVIGVLITWISAILISHLTGGQDLTNLNTQLLSPCIRKLIPKKYRDDQSNSMENSDKAPANEEMKPTLSNSKVDC
ncbi:sodium-coupled monocarboxylate transporter 2-like isoform X2 [Sitodiplosis mosellana]|nr:sodium-coupled monocarboxylate transporter 2-like isoform X2 [Sitodiplosis mosellana]